VRNSHPLATFFTLSYTISWLIWTPLWLPAFGVHGLPVLPFHHALGGLGPIAAAFLVSALEHGSTGTGDLLRHMLLWRGRLLWVAVGLLTPFVLLAFAVAWLSFADGEIISIAKFGSHREFPQFSALGFLVYNVISFGYGEEVGWRGFALPRLQIRHSALYASLLLTLGWAVWHIPLFFYHVGYTSMNLTGIAGWFFSLMTGSVLLTWLYNESRGSILVVALFHASTDMVFTASNSVPSVVNIAGALMTVLGIVVLITTGPQFLSRRGKMISLDDGDGITRFAYRDGRVALSAL
jgi:uncharacterized protein